MTGRRADASCAEPVVNRWRGEASLTVQGVARCLRPSFAALVAAEEELGPLLAMVERAAAGGLRLGEIVALFWHCLADRQGLTRDVLGEAVIELGLAKVAGPLRGLLEQIVQGAG